MSDITYRCVGCLAAFSSHEAFEEHAKICQALKDWLDKNKADKEVTS